VIEMKSRNRIALGIVALAALLAACSGEGIDVDEAQAQFCSDVEDYVGALDTYGGLFQEVELTVGDVQSADDDLEPAREAVLDSAAAFQEAVQADPDSAVTIEIVEPESIQRVEDAEGAFADAVAGIDQRTLVTEAGVAFTSAAYQLQVAWTLLFADAGCIEDEAQATQWVSDYVTALQTDLQAAGYYGGRIDGVYGPQTIAAVEQLQEDSGLPVTGLMDPATQTALAALLGQEESAQTAALQGILTATGYYSGPIDGQWSAQVEEALKALQTDLGVPATGVIDAATLRAFEEALVEAGNPPPPTTSSTEPTATTTPEPATTTLAQETTTTVAQTSTTAAPPPTLPPVEGGILDVLAEAGQFTQLLAAIDAAGLTETLSGPGPFTLFAPTDEAFAAATLPDDPDALQAIILYHVVQENLSGFDLMGLDSVTTAQGGDLAVSVESGQIVLGGTSTVTVSNVVGVNGTAHAVNAVLFPPG
jgi:uncharacterized surface protein with fasciclin (FAS1) repeats